MCRSSQQRSSRLRERTSLEAVHRRLGQPSQPGADSGGPRSRRRSAQGGSSAKSPATGTPGTGAGVHFVAAQHEGLGLAQIRFPLMNMAQ